MATADENLFLWINGIAGNFSPLDNVVRWIASDYLVPVAMALTLVALWFTGQNERARMRHQIGLFVALASMGLSSLSVFIINAVYFRPRPFDTPGLDVELLFYRPTDSSFPSNSAAAAVAIATAVWAVNRPVGVFLIAAAALYGFGRVYVGVHYPLDIAAGAAIGVVVTCLTLGLKNLLQPLPTWVVKAARILCLA